MIKNFIDILKFITKSFKAPYYGIVQGHLYLINSQIIKINRMCAFHTPEKVVQEYEKKFTALIGTGEGLNFAAGRMAFYSLMKVLNIGDGDEVILQGATCSVMPNAVWRIGAKPVFADVDPETFGTSQALLLKGSHLNKNDCGVIFFAK